MEIKRYCGRERLPGGERRWRRLARAAGFAGRLELYGYGLGGRPGQQQLFAYNHGIEKGYTIGDYGPGVIRVWLPCSCAAADLEPRPSPLDVFAHELGHFIQHKRGTRHTRMPHIEEAVATRYGRMLLSRIA